MVTSLVSMAECGELPHFCPSPSCLDVIVCRSLSVCPSSTFMGLKRLTAHLRSSKLYQQCVSFILYLIRIPAKLFLESDRNPRTLVHLSLVSTCSLSDALDSHSVWIIRIRTLSRSPRRANIALAMVTLLDLTLSYTNVLYNASSTISKQALVFIETGKQLNYFEYTFCDATSFPQDSQSVSTKCTFTIKIFFNGDCLFETAWLTLAYVLVTG